MKIALLKFSALTLTRAFPTNSTTLLSHKQINRTIGISRHPISSMMNFILSVCFTGSKSRPINGTFHLCGQVLVDYCLYITSKHTVYLTKLNLTRRSDLITKKTHRKITQNVGTNLRLCYYCINQCHPLSRIQSMEIRVQHC